MKNKGFTLIELLAVILILGIITVIAIPTIGNMVQESEEKNFYNSALGINKAAIYYRINADEDEKQDTIDLSTDIMPYKGKHYEGMIYFDENDNFKFFIKSKKYCAVKDFKDDKPRLIDDKDCSILSVSGELISLDNKLKFNNSLGDNLKNVIITGKTNQNIVPYFNYVDFDDINTYITCCGSTTMKYEIINDGSSVSGKRVKATYTSDGGFGFLMKKSVSKLTVGKKYTWSITILSTTPGSFQIGLEQGGVKTVNLTSSFQTITKTFTATEAENSGFIVYANSTMPTNTRIDVREAQLVDGDKVPTSYTYNTEVIPSPNFIGTIKSLGESTSATVVTTGKNIYPVFNDTSTAMSPKWNRVGWGSSTFALQPDGSIKFSIYNGWEKYYLKLPEVYANKKIRLSAKVKYNIDTEKEYVEGLYISRTSKYDLGSKIMTKADLTTEYKEVSGTLTVQSDCMLGLLMRLTSEGTYHKGTIYLKDLMVELVDDGETLGAIEYEPYKSMIANISLASPLACVGNVCDSIDFNKGKIIRRVGKKIINSTNVNNYTYTKSSNSNTNFTEFTISSGESNYFDTSNKSKVTCDRLSYYDKADQSNPTSEGIILSGGNNIVSFTFNKSRLTTQDVAGLKTWISSNPIEILGALKTSYEETIALPEIKTYEGINNIYIVDSNGICNTISATYRKKR